MDAQGSSLLGNAGESDSGSDLELLEAEELALTFWTVASAVEAKSSLAGRTLEAFMAEAMARLRPMLNMMGDLERTGGQGRKKRGSSSLLLRGSRKQGGLGG